MDSITDAIDVLLKQGDLEKAAQVARRLGQRRRAAELLALLGKHAEAVLEAIEANEWRLALELALQSANDPILDAVCQHLARQGDVAAAAAAQARMGRRIDIAARLLEVLHPLDAAAAWYECGEYLRAAQCWDRGGQPVQAIASLEQHLAQNPEDHAAADRLAELRAARGDVEGAVRALQASVRAEPKAPSLRKLVDGLARLGMEGAARSVIQRLRSIDPAATLALEDYAEALPRSVAEEKRYAGRYRVVREVGSGASGRVLEAVDELTGEPVALKILSVGDDRSGAFGRFMREAELARVLEHPTLVRMRAMDPEGPCIVFDWMPGGTLGERLATMSFAEMRAVVLRLLAALEVLHRNGVVHRDLKPSNVLFDAGGQARLGDLGAAHLGDLGATVTGGLVGSLPYMAPEQVTGQSVTAATDLYALGCMLFQMVTGSLPYAGPDFVPQHLSAPIPLASERRPALGTDYDAALLRLLTKNPLERVADVPEARGLLMQLPWAELEPAARTSLLPTHLASLPPPAPGERRRLEATERAEVFVDTRLERRLELVSLPVALRELVLRWARASSASLQPVYDVTEEGASLVLWAEPLLPATPGPGDARVAPREELEAQVQQLGLPLRAAQSAVFDARYGWTLPVRALAAV